MKIKLENTTKIVEVNGVPARIWQGKTESGIAVHCFITRVAIDENETRTEEFENELKECISPFGNIEVYPNKITLGEEKTEGYISDELTISHVDFQGDRVQVFFVYLGAYIANAIYPISNKGYLSFKTEKLPIGISTAIEDEVSEYKNEIFEYVQQKVKEDSHD